MKQITLAASLLILATPACSSLLYQPSREILVDTKKFGINNYDDVTFVDAEGVSIHGWYFKNTKGIPPKAVLVFFHGNGENLTTHFAALYWLLAEGFDYLIFDYRGYGQSQGTSTPRNTVLDGIAALCFSHQKFPEIPLVVYGQSLGGAVALRAVIESKENLPIQYVVADSTFDSYQSVGRTVLAKRWLTWIFQPLVYVLLADGWAPEGRLDEISPIPLLVIHGDEDQIVDFQHGEALFEDALEPKEFLRIERGHHIDAFWRDKGKYRTIVLEKIERAIAGEAPLRISKNTSKKFCAGYLK